MTTNKTLSVGTDVVVNFHNSGIAGNAHIVDVRETDNGVVYDIVITLVTPDPSQDPKELQDLGYKVVLKDIPAVLVLEVIYDPSFMSAHQSVAQEAENAIQDAIVVSEDDAILDAMKSLVIEHETNKAETETMKVNRDVDAE